MDKKVMESKLMEKVTPDPKMQTYKGSSKIGEEINYNLVRNALVGLVGEDDPYELGGMEEIVKVMDIPEDEKVRTLDAIHALIATQPAPPKNLEGVLRCKQS